MLRYAQEVVLLENSLKQTKWSCLAYISSHIQSGTPQQRRTESAGTFAFASEVFKPRISHGRESRLSKMQQVLIKSTCEDFTFLLDAECAVLSFASGRPFLASTSSVVLQEHNSRHCFELPLWVQQLSQLATTYLCLQERDLKLVYNTGPIWHRGWKKVIGHVGTSNYKYIIRRTCSFDLRYQQPSFFQQKKPIGQVYHLK